MNKIIPTRDNTCAVIVTYHPDEGFPERLKKVEAEFSLIIVVDNGSQYLAVEMLRRLSSSSHIILVENRHNLGIAAALNQGVKLASREGFQWVVTFDQDTVIRPNFLATIIDVYLKSGSDEVLIGSNYWDVHKGRNFIQCDETVTVFQERKTLITSGTLVPLSLFEKIGFFREDYFIDSVDHEYSLRARAHGFRIFISCRPLMNHSIGAGFIKANRLRQMLSLNHSLTRKYFIARNSIATAKIYFFREPVWSIRQGSQLVAIFLSVLLFDREKIKQYRALVVGVAHGVIGKMGPIEKTWPNGSY
jgi:rhamnosyltransferase